MARDALVVTGFGIVHPGASAAGRDGAWFDPTAYALGAGSKFLTLPTRYALASMQVAREMAKLADDAYAPEERGIAMGTNFGTYATWRKMLDTIASPGAHALSPMEAPNFSVNLAASQLSIRQAWRAFNLTITSPVTAGLDSLLLCQQALRRARGRVALAGAFEEALADGVAAAAGLEAGVGGACSLVLESWEDATRRGVPMLARLGEGLQLFVPASEPTSPFFRYMQEALVALVPNPRRVVIVGPDSPLKQAVLTATAEVFAGAGVACEAVGCPEGSLSALLAVGNLLAASQPGLVVAIAPQGNLAAVSLLDPAAPF